MSAEEVKRFSEDAEEEESEHNVTDAGEFFRYASSQRRSETHRLRFR